MNTRLHDILDGDLSEGNEDDLFELPEERHEFQDQLNLRAAMRQNANEGGLTSAEKADIRAGLAAAIGLPLAEPAPTAVPPQAGAGAATVVATAGSWYGKGLLALLLGIAIGAGVVLLLGNNTPHIVERTVGVPVQTAIPSTVPYGMPEPAAAQCDSLVDQLRDSLRTLQSQAKSKVKKKGGAPRWIVEPPPTPGD